MTDKTKPFLYIDFNADQVLAKFGFDRDSDEGKAALFVYDVLYAAQSPGMDRLTRSQSAAKAAIEHIEFRYNLYKEHAQEFFCHGKEFNRRAFVLAVISGNLLPEAQKAHESAKENPDAKSRFIGEYLNDAAVEDGIEILEEVDSMMMGAWFFPEKDPYTESFFIAHIDAMQQLYDLEKNFEAYSRDELQTFMQEKMKPYETFVQPQTSFGASLEEYARIVRRKIEERLSEPQKPKRPFLRLVTQDFPGPQ